MYFVRDAHAELAGLDLGSPVKAATAPTIGAHTPTKQTGFLLSEGLSSGQIRPAQGTSGTRKVRKLLTTPRQISVFAATLSWRLRRALVH
jgi:hypothetical protein